MKFFRRDSVQPFLAKIDNERLQEIQKRYADSSHRSARYAAVERWLNRAPGGNVLLEINSGKDGRYFPADVRAFFLKHGARLDGERVLFGFGSH